MKKLETFTATAETPMKGRTWPMREALANYAAKTYKSDRRKAKRHDKTNCILAMGIKRDKQVVYVEVGSGGDVWVVFRDKSTGEEYALHYVTTASCQRIIDTFDKKGSPDTQIAWLLAPSKSRTIAVRRVKERKRAAAQQEQRAAATSEGIKQHVEFDAVRGGKKKRRSRAERLGMPDVHCRPRAKISTSSCSLTDIDDEQEGDRLSA
jgi:hypothetical protein